MMIMGSYETWEPWKWHDVKMTPHVGMIGFTMVYPFTTQHVPNDSELRGQIHDPKSPALEDV
jgi:hypothetical protein